MPLLINNRNNSNNNNSNNNNNRCNNNNKPIYKCRHNFHKIISRTKKLDKGVSGYYNSNSNNKINRMQITQLFRIKPYLNNPQEF